MKTRTSPRKGESVQPRASAAGASGVRRRAGCGARLFILPHMLVGLGFLVIMMPGSILWAVFGVDEQRAVTRVWEGRTSKGKPTYSLAYRGPAGSDEPGERSISYEEFRQLRSAQGEAAVESAAQVTVRRWNVWGQWGVEKVLMSGESRWGVVGFIWLFGLLWNSIASVFIYRFYFRPRRATGGG